MIMIMIMTKIVIMTIIFFDEETLERVLWSIILPFISQFYSLGLLCFKKVQTYTTQWSLETKISHAKFANCFFRFFVFPY